MRSAACGARRWIGLLLAILALQPAFGPAPAPAQERKPAQKQAPVAAPAPLSASAAPPDEARIESLILRMTPQEKAGQLSLFAPADAASVNPAGPSLGEAAQLAEIRAGRVTGLFNNAGRAGKRRAQQAAVHESRLGIPLLFAADVIHGFHTIFPVPLAEAASWEPELAQRTARAAAVEASREGFRWTFAPMVDIARDARWGRGVEGAGEDVLLARRFAEARVRGFQGDDLGRADAMLATPKHFAAYGAAEAGLDYGAADISERTLREVYLPPFQAALDAGALALMTGFNEVAGVPATANAALLDGVLRREWRYEGVTVSDYTADEELVAHGLAADTREAARLAFLAGTDISMQSGLYLRHLPELLAAGAVPQARLDAAVRRVLRVKARLGLFEAPFRGLEAQDDAAAAADRALQQAHRALAREAARRSAVLLKNDGGLLPLARNRGRIALIGPFARGTQDGLGPWSLFPGGPPPVALDAALRSAAGPGTELLVEPGSAVDQPLPGGLERAVAAARRADVVLLAVGESPAMSGEARSRTEVVLPPAQQALAEAVAGTGTPVVVLLRNGRALALEGAVREARAILVTWFLGHEAAPAIADLVFGDASPSGRLPVSFPQRPGQVPLYYARKRSGRPLPADDPQADYKARYVEVPAEALYPFGHGLGYAPVRYEALTLDREHLAWDGRLQVRAWLHNEGLRAVDEVVQLYLRPRSAPVTRPLRELKAFRKLRLEPGERVPVRFSLDRTDLQQLGADLRPGVAPGRFDVWVAPSATTGLHAEFELLPG